MPTGPIWRVGANPTPLEPAEIVSEQQLEEMLISNLRILSPNWMLVGNQINTGSGRIDILAVSRDGTLVIIELKRHSTSRDVVAQTLEYLSWANAQTPATIEALYLRKTGHELGDAFREQFGVELGADSLNAQQLAVIVAARPSAATEQIVKYLTKIGVPINLNTFEVFKDDEGLLMKPNWLVDLSVTEIDSGGKGVWNLQYYCSFGHDEERNWEDARQYGFFSAGGGAWYSRTLDLLEPGSLIWVLVPNYGYTGVGRILTERMPFHEFMVQRNGQDILLQDMELRGTYINKSSPDDDTTEYMVGVEWLYTVPLEQAFKQAGLFGNQNSVCRPRSAKWVHTVNTLMSHWKPNLEE